VKARGMLMPVNDPEVGEYAFTRSPIHLSDAPELPKNAAPKLGEHTGWVLREVLGYDEEKVAGLVDSEIVEVA